MLNKIYGEFEGKHQATTAALITACNPKGIKTSEDANQSRMTELRVDIESVNLPYYPAYGANLDESWKEESYLVIGLDQTACIAMGHKYEQNAIVWIDERETPSLIWMNTMN